MIVASFGQNPSLSKLFFTARSATTATQVPTEPTPTTPTETIVLAPTIPIVEQIAPAPTGPLTPSISTEFAPLTIEPAPALEPVPEPERQVVQLPPVFITPTLPFEEEPSLEVTEDGEVIEPRIPQAVEPPPSNRKKLIVLGVGAVAAIGLVWLIFRR